MFISLIHVLLHNKRINLISLNSFDYKRSTLSIRFLFLHNLISANCPDLDGMINYYIEATNIDGKVARQVLDANQRAAKSSSGRLFVIFASKKKGRKRKNKLLN